MAFSAVFTYYDLICLKLSILFLALGNVKTKLFIAENEKKKKHFWTTWSQNSISLFRTSTFQSNVGFKRSKTATELAKKLWFTNSISWRYIISYSRKTRFRAIWLSFLFNLHNKCPAWDFTKWKCWNSKQGLLNFAKFSAW